LNAFEEVMKDHRRSPPDAPTYADGARRVAPLAVAVLAFGVTYGLIARAGGFPVAATLVFSATTFAGSAQFAAVSVLSGGGTLVAAVVAALLLNARYVPIGASVAPALTGPWWRRLLAGQLAVDEAWAISNVGRGRYDARLLIGAGLVLYAAWLGGTAVGVAGGGFLGDPEKLGLDAAFPALFLALLVGQVHDRRGMLAALLGGAIGLVLVPLTPAGVPIIAASVACLIGLRGPAPTVEEEMAQESVP
jgi:4-azaleucine resistance transporter AzlC